MGMQGEISNEISFTERLSDIIAMRLNRQLHKEGVELMKMKLGLEILLINITKFAIVFIVAAQFKLLKETAFMSLIFACVRKSAFGLHAKNSIVCTITTLIMFVAGSYAGHYIKLNNYVVFYIFLTINLLLFKYAPSDTENHPLLSEKLRKKLRKKTVSTGMLLMLIALISTSYLIKALITLAVSYEVISILPITYKILNRGYKNYEKYERTSI